MPRVRGYGFTRKDKIFAELETDYGKYLFKETHSSKGSYYKVNIYFEDAKTGVRDKRYSINLTREAINKIKQDGSIASIEFMSEDKFLSYIENTYLNKEFNEEHFSTFFSDHFSRAYSFINGNYYDYKNSEGRVEEYYSYYLAYLASLVPRNILENVYYNSPDAFRKIFKYKSDYFTYLSSAEGKLVIGRTYQLLDKAKAEFLQALNVNNIEYQSYDEFVSSGNYQNYRPKRPNN